MIIFAACLITVCVEAAFLALFGFRSREELLIISCANVITNLTLNLSLMLIVHLGGNYAAWVYWLEALVVAAEYLIYARAFGPGWRLFFLTLGANSLSYSLGLLIF